MSDIPRLSLCMIVKNEEDCIGRCLNSVKDIVDEIIIVDTGSTDRTIEICHSFGAQIYPFTWNESFSDARNHGLERATGDWILWMDADEEVDAEDRLKLRDVLFSNTFDIFSIPLVNYYGDQVHADQVTTIAHIRLFRNHRGIKFINKIHERLNVTDVDEMIAKQFKYGLLDVKIYHYGYMDSYVKKKDKFKRNLLILEKDLENKENLHWTHYYLANEYYRDGQCKKAFEHVNSAILEFIKEGYMPPSMLYKLKYAILVSTASWDGAWPSIQKAIEMYPDYVDLYFFKGIILFHKGNFHDALNTFERCIQIGEENIEHMILKGVGSFQAWYYKGLCYEKLEKDDDALHAYVKSIEISPSYTPSIDVLLGLINKLQLPLQSFLSQNFSENVQSQLTRFLDSQPKVE